MSWYIASCIAGGVHHCILGSPPARKLAGVHCSTPPSLLVCKRRGGRLRMFLSPAAEAPGCTIGEEQGCMIPEGFVRTVLSLLGCRLCLAPVRKHLSLLEYIVCERQVRIGCVARQSSSHAGYLCNQLLLFAWARWCNLVGEHFYTLPLALVAQWVNIVAFELWTLLAYTPA